MSTPFQQSISFAGYRYPPEIISYAVWLYFQYPLSLRMVEDLLAERGIHITYETVRKWAAHFGKSITIRSAMPVDGEPWLLEELVVTLNGKKHWLWRVINTQGMVLDMLVQARRNPKEAERAMQQLLARSLAQETPPE